MKQTCRELIDLDIKLNSIAVPALSNGCDSSIRDSYFHDAVMEGYLDDLLPPIVEIRELDDVDDEIVKELTAEYFSSFPVTLMIAEFSTPVPIYDEGKSYSSSWGYTTSIWLKGKTLEDLCKQAIKWRNEYHDEIKNQTKSKKKA